MKQYVPTRRSLLASLVAPPSRPAARSVESQAWRVLVRQLEAADALAMHALAQVERRHFTSSHEQRGEADPDWYVAAQRAEAEAAAVFDHLVHQIARARAVSRQALAIKVRLLAAAYGEDLSRRPLDAEDLVSCLIRSLNADLV